MSVRIIGIGKALPKKVVLNDDLPKELETSDEWIRSHTGIRQRYFSDENETSAFLGAEAAKNALADCAAKGKGLSAAEIDLIVCASASTTHWTFPSNACLIQRDIGAKDIPAFDVTAACSGFIYGLQVARSMLKEMKLRHALVVGAETLTKVTDWHDRSTCVLFGDGAGAAVLERDDAPGPDCFGTVILGADGGGADVLYLGTDDRLLHMDGHAVYSFAVGKMAELIRTLMEKDSLTIDDVDLIVCHQANERIITSAAKRLGYPPEKFALTIGEYANTSSASIPIALADLCERGVVKSGMKLILAGFGAGLTWGGCTLTW